MNLLKVLFILVSIALAFIPFKGDFFGYSHLAGKFFDFLHFPFFSILAVLVLGLNLKVDENKRYRLVILVVLTVMIEVIQKYTGRSPSIIDVLWGWLGIGFGLAWYASRPVRYYLVTGVLMCYICVLALNIYVLFLAQSRLPVVNNMESIFTTYLFDNMNEIKDPTFESVWSDDTKSLVLKGSKVDFNWSGFSYKFPLYADLRSYRELSMEYYSPKYFSELDIRFNSENGRKIFTVNNIKSGWNNINLKFDSTNNNEVDWGEVNGFAVFYESKYGPDTYLVDNIIFK
jgi:hypothetical protein